MWAVARIWKDVGLYGSPWTAEAPGQPNPIQVGRLFVAFFYKKKFLRIYVQQAN
jgi:hypothetical protein